MEQILISVDKFACLFCAVLILLFPLKWLLCAVLAAAVHEVFHILAVYLLGGRVYGIRIFASGALIEADGLEGFREGLCAAAGPLGSFLLVCFIHRFPVLGLCALVQGSFNLLPVYPMDGGRILRSVLKRIWPEKAECYSYAAEILILFLLLLFVIKLSVCYELGVIPSFYCILAITRGLLRKRP